MTTYWMESVGPVFQTAIHPRNSCRKCQLWVDNGQKRTFRRACANVSLMRSEDWFRNTEWNEAIAMNFEAKLRRARRKEQYVRIQAGCLATKHPDVALGLIDRFLAMPDQFDQAQAYCDRARAY